MGWAAALGLGAAAVALAMPSDAAVPIRAGSPPGTYEGVIEGFYGTPWSHADRRSMILWLGRHRMNAFVYAPKDDPYQRQAWRELYPAEASSRLRELAALGRRVGVHFVYSISPGLDMCYSSAGERAALRSKLDQLRGLGIRSFMLAFDDIPRSFHCPEDLVAFGRGEAGLGRAHAEVANAVLRWISGGRLIVVPTDYAELVRTPYLDALARRLARQADLVWTGPYVVSSRISTGQADAVARVYGRRPVLWDNYPVNDFAPEDLHLGPIAGRPAALPRHLAGFLANPMNQAEASKVPLYTIASYLRDPERYRPEEAWRKAVQELGGRRGAAVLRRLADNSQSSSTLDDPHAIWSRESSVLWPRALLVARSLRGLSWSGRLLDADRRLRLEWRTLVELPRLAGPRLEAEVDPWIRTLAANSDLGRAALRYVAATRPRFRSVRLRRSGSGWEVTGRLAAPNREELDRLAAEVDVTSAVRRRLPKETHGGSTLFLHGMAAARKACTPTAVRATLDGRRLSVAGDGRFHARTPARPGRLVARDRRGIGSVYDFAGGRSPVPPAGHGERRARRQVLARLGALAGAVRREDLGALRRYDLRPGALDAWRGLLAVSRFPYVRFPLGAFEAGALRCGGPVVAQVTWKLAGRIRGGPSGKRGLGTLGRPTVLLLANRGSARAPDWRIVYALPFLPYPNPMAE